MFYAHKSQSILAAHKADCQLSGLCALMPKVAITYKITINRKFDKTLSARYNWHFDSKIANYRRQVDELYCVREPIAF